MTQAFQVLSWDGHKDVAGSNLLMGPQPSPLDKWISNCINNLHRLHTITNMNDNITSTKAGSVNATVASLLTNIISNMMSDSDYSKLFMNSSDHVIKAMLFWYSQAFESNKSGILLSEQLRTKCNFLSYSMNTFKIVFALFERVSFIQWFWITKQSVVCHLIK